MRELSKRLKNHADPRHAITERMQALNYAIVTEEAWKRVIIGARWPHEIVQQYAGWPNVSKVDPTDLYAPEWLVYFLRKGVGYVEISRATVEVEFREQLYALIADGLEALDNLRGTSET